MIIPGIIKQIAADGMNLRYKKNNVGEGTHKTIYVIQLRCFYIYKSIYCFVFY